MIKSNSKSESTSQKIGRLGELEFEFFISKLKLLVRGRGLFGEEKRMAYLRPIKNHLENDFGIDYSAEVFWESADNGEPTGLTLLFQVKAWSGNPTFKQKDYDYFVRQSYSRPVILVWKKDDDFYFLNFTEWNSKSGHHEIITKIRTHGTFSIGREDWTLLDLSKAELWFSEIIQAWYDKILTHQLSGIDAITIPYSRGILIGAITALGYKTTKIEPEIFRIEVGSSNVLLGVAKRSSKLTLIPDPTKGGLSVSSHDHGYNRSSLQDAFSRIDPQYDRAIIVSFDHVLEAQSSIERECGYHILDIHFDMLFGNLECYIQKIKSLLTAKG